MNTPTRGTMEEGMLDLILTQLMSDNPKLLAPTELGYRMALHPRLPTTTLKKIMDPRALHILQM